MLRRTRPLIDNSCRYEDDFTCRVFVSMYPQGQSLAMIGELMGISRERVRQIEARALKKCATYVKQHKITIDLPESGEEFATTHGAGRKAHR